MQCFTRRSTSSSLKTPSSSTERGATVRMLVDMAGDSVSLWSEGERLETVRFAGEICELGGEIAEDVR